MQLPYLNLTMVGYIGMLRHEEQFQGFTILELMVGLVIMGVVAGLFYPRYLASVEQFRAREGDQILLSLYGAQKRYALENGGNYTNNMASLDIEIRPSTVFEAPTVSTVNPLASITIRSDQTSFGNYTLSINDDATISCSGGSSSICQKMGYP
jgi:prepilin-type N-terminal cleavage/methylation domain-containing protein